MGTVRPTVYIPNLNGRERLRPALAALREQSLPADVVVIDNGSIDDSVEMVRTEFPEVSVLELDQNLGFGTAINRAVAGGKADPLIVLNNDASAEPRFIEALIEEAAGAEMGAGVLLSERSPETIDSAGILADATLMTVDHLQGESLQALEGAAHPLGPTGAAALYRRSAFEAVGGFDERIFLYYEDLDLALRLRSAGARCRLAPAARALHAYSATLGPNSARKFAHTGWSRGYVLRRYGVMSSPRLALRALICEGTICGGQLLMHGTAAGIISRLRGWHAGAGLERRPLERSTLIDISTREALALRRRRHG